MDDSSAAQGSRPPFPKTRWTLIRDASDPASPTYRQSMEHLATTYWRPIYAYFRRKWNKADEEARDLTQDFFAALCERDFLRHLSPDYGRFRSYVMAALDNFVRLQYRSGLRLKRGGGAVHLPIDMNGDVDISSGDSPDILFLREWARTLLGESLREMEQEYRQGGQESGFRLFCLRDVSPPAGQDVGYDTLSRKFGTSVTEVTNILYRARKRLREIVLSKVRDTVTSEEEAEAEMRELFEPQESP